MKKQFIAIGLLVLVLALILVFVRKGSDGGIEGETYQSDKYGFAFNIPDGYNFSEDDAEHISVGEKVEVELLTGPKSNFASFEDFLTGQLSNVCATVGTTASTTCDRITSAQGFTSDSGVPGGEVYLNRIHSALSVGSTTTSSFGPIYIFSIQSPTTSDFAVLVVRPPANLSSDQIDAEIIKFVARSMKFPPANTPEL